MMEIVTGFQGKNHVTAQQLSRLIAGLAGDGIYILDTQDQLAAEVVSANKVTIATGDLIAEGTYFTNEAPEELTIENGVTGLNRNDLIVCRYKKAEPEVDEDGNPDYTIPRIESGEWAVVKGTPSSGTPEDPSVVTASLQDPSTSLAEFPVYRLPIRGLAVETPEQIPPSIPSMRDACDSLSQRRISYEDVKLTLNLGSDASTVGQPNLHLLTCQQANADNFIFKQLISFWPQSTWDNALVIMGQRYSTGMAWNRCWFKTTKAQTYDLWIRVWYWV